MADVLDKIRKLLRLALSDNPNEARNSAYTAARLIHEHKVVLSLPGDAPTPPPPGFTAVPTPPPVTRPPKKTRDVYGHWWYFFEDGPRYGGHCLYCALPLLRGQAAYSNDDGLLHLGCWNERQLGKTRPGPAPPPQRRPPPPEPTPAPNTRQEEAAAIDDLWSKIDSGRK